MLLFVTKKRTEQCVYPMPQFSPDLHTQFSNILKRTEPFLGKKCFPLGKKSFHLCLNSDLTPSHDLMIVKELRGEQPAKKKKSNGSFETRWYWYPIFGTDFPNEHIFELGESAISILPS